MSDLRGKLGDVVYTRGRGGLMTRQYLRPHDPHTDAQQAVRANLAAASRAFRALSPAQTAAWQAYADSLVRHDPISGTLYHPSAWNAFNALALKLLQMRPDSTLPSLPPAEPFPGDTLVVTAEITGGYLVWTASAPNAPDITTELLAQRLRGTLRKPDPRQYRTQAFFAFTADTLTAATPPLPGRFALAYRFVHARTGQRTPLFPLPPLPGM
jgi:hypothetical protein